MKLLPPALLAAAVWAGALSLQYAVRFDENDGRQKVAQLKKAVDERRALNERIKANNAQMRATVRELDEAPDAVVEELARKWLFMIKPDEVYVLPPETPAEKRQ